MKSSATHTETRPSVHASAWPLVSLGEILTQRSPDVRVEPTENYQFAGVYCFGRGVFRGPLKKGNEFAYPVLTRLRAGEFVYPKLMAWEGAFGVVPKDCAGCYVSPEFPVFEIDPTKADPRFVESFFRMASTWETISAQSTGTNVRRRRLNPSDLLRHQIPLASLEEQRSLVRLLARIAEARAVLTNQVEDLQTLEHSMLKAALTGEFDCTVLFGKLSAIQRPSDARTYIVQFVPALLRAVDGPLSLEEVGRAYALLFKPDILLPLIEATGGAAARRHLAELPPLDAKVFAQMLQELHRAGVIEQDAATDDLHLGKVSAPPTAAAVAEDARLLAAILTLVPREAVRTMTRKLCPKPARELFATVS